MTVDRAEYPRADYKDSVIETLAAGEAEWMERAITAEAERDSFRLLAQEAIHYAHQLQEENRRLAQSLERVRDENRDLRAAGRTAA